MPAPEGGRPGGQVVEGGVAAGRAPAAEVVLGEQGLLALSLRVPEKKNINRETVQTTRIVPSPPRVRPVAVEDLPSGLHPLDSPHDDEAPAGEAADHGGVARVVHHAER